MDSVRIIQKIKEIIKEEKDGESLYPEVKQIGYGALSFVYYIMPLEGNPKTNKVIKCFERYKDDYVELELYEKMKETPNIRYLSIPNDIFYITENTGARTSLWDSEHRGTPSGERSCDSPATNKYCCLELPYYESDLSKFDIKSCSVNQKKIFIEQLQKGINELHLLGYYHGDLKKENICIVVGSGVPITKDEGMELRIIDFGLSDKIENSIMELRLKNTFKDASPIQMAYHLRRFIMDCPCQNEECKDCKKDKKLLKKLIESIRRHNAYIVDEIDDVLDFVIEEKCIVNDMWGVGLLMYYIITGENFFSKSIFKLIEETIDFLDNTEKFIDKKIAESERIVLNDGDEMIELFEIFKTTMKEYLNGIRAPCKNTV
jgi:serine/threonine protein kinase